MNLLPLSVTEAKEIIRKPSTTLSELEDIAYNTHLDEAVRAAAWAELDFREGVGHETDSPLGRRKLS